MRVLGQEAFAQHEARALEALMLAAESEMEAQASQESCHMSIACLHLSYIVLMGLSAPQLAEQCSGNRSAKCFAITIGDTFASWRKLLGAPARDS